MSDFSTTHQFLRSQTSQAHKDVERFSPLAAIVDQSLADPIAYGNILLDFAELLDAFEARTALEFFRIHEQMCSGHSDHLGSEQLKSELFLSRRQLLQQDLNALGLRPRQVRTELLKRQDEIARLGTSGWFGAAYVLQGQTLGASLIFRSLQMSPLKSMLARLPSLEAKMPGSSTVRPSEAVHAQAPFLFFNGHASKTSMLWSEFLRSLEIAVPVNQSASLQQALAGALNVFHAFLVVWKRS